MHAVMNGTLMMSVVEVRLAPPRRRMEYITYAQPHRIPPHILGRLIILRRRHMCLKFLCRHATWGVGSNILRRTLIRQSSKHLFLQCFLENKTSRDDRQECKRADIWTHVRVSVTIWVCDPEAAEFMAAPDGLITWQRC